MCNHRQNASLFKHYYVHYPTRHVHTTRKLQTWNHIHTGVYCKQLECCKYFVAMYVRILMLSASVNYAKSDRTI